MPSAYRITAATVLLSATFCFTSARIASASAFSLESDVGANLGCKPFTTECLTVDDPIDVDIFGVNGGLVTHHFDDGALVGDASAQASFGLLKVMASATVNVADDTRFTFGQAQANDTITISALGLNGTAGFLDVTFVISGTVSNSGVAGAAPSVGVGSGGLLSQHTYLGFPNPSETFTAQVPIIFGTAFDLHYFLVVGAGTGTMEATGSGTATGDFSHSFLLTGLVPTNLAHVAIANPQFQSASGTNYTTAGVNPVPEPASMLLFGSGLAGVLARRRTRRR